jgi:hypothetical protein
MYGGTVRAGPLPGGGFGVVARLPCPEQPELPELPEQPAAAAAGWAGA